MALPPVVAFASLCSGGGGLDLGVHRALARLGARGRCVVHVEREAYAAACLVARMEEAAMDRAPVWDDLGSFDGRRFRGRVDLVAAGFPCQPASVAGARRGRLDERWIWPSVERVIGEIDPEWVFLENVRGLLSVDGGEGFAQVIGGLDRLGFDAEWCVLRASDVGAPHRRERVFVLAHARGVEGELHARAREGVPAPAAGGDAVADASSSGRDEGNGRVGEARSRPELDDSEQSMGHSVGARLARREGERGHDREERATAERAGGLDVADTESGELRHEPGRRGGEDRPGAPEPGAHRPFPPGPGDLDGWREYLAFYPDLAPAVEPALRRGADGLADRVGRLGSRGRPGSGYTTRADELRLLGNGVVPEQAARAFVELYERHFDYFS